MNKKLTDNIEMVINDTEIVCTYEESIAALLNSFNEKKLSHIKMLKKALYDLDEDEFVKLMQFYLDISMAKSFLSVSDEKFNHWCKKYPETNVSWLKEKILEKSPCPHFLKYIQEGKIKPEVAFERLISIRKNSDLISKLEWPHMKKINDEMNIDVYEERQLLIKTMESCWFFNTEVSCLIKKGQEKELTTMWESLFKKIFIEDFRSDNNASNEEAYNSASSLLNVLVPEDIKNKDWYNLLMSNFELLVEKYKDGKMAYGQEYLLDCLVKELVNYNSKSFLKEPSLSELNESYISKKDTGIFIAEALLGNLYYAHKFDLALSKGAKRWIIDEKSPSRFSFAEIYQIKKAIVDILKDTYPQYSQDLSLKLNWIFIPEELLKSPLIDKIVNKFKECVKNGYPENIVKEIDVIITKNVMVEDMNKNQSKVMNHKVKKF